jgi:hypothetical protein
MPSDNQIYKLEVLLFEVVIVFTFVFQDLMNFSFEVHHLPVISHNLSQWWKMFCLLDKALSS